VRWMTLRAISTRPSVLGCITFAPGAYVSTILVATSCRVPGRAILVAPKLAY